MSACQSTWLIALWHAGERNEATFMDPESFPGWFQSELIDACELVLAVNDDILYK